MGELRRCPKCGTANPRFIMRYNKHLLFKRYYVECWKCRFSIRPRISVKRAAMAWNRIRRYKYAMPQM